jgi:hypothetical protein
LSFVFGHRILCSNLVHILSLRLHYRVSEIYDNIRRWQLTKSNTFLSRQPLSLSINIPPSAEHKISLPCSKEVATGSCSRSAISNPHPHTVSVTLSHFFSRPRTAHINGFFPSYFPTKTSYKFLFPLTRHPYHPPLFLR